MGRVGARDGLGRAAACACTLPGRASGMAAWRVSCLVTSLVASLVSWAASAGPCAARPADVPSSAPVPSQASRIVSAPAAPLYLHIAAQPLATALERYAVLTDQTVLFSDELVAGRRSRELQGYHSPQEALNLLLAGTQLRAERVGQGDESSFVLRELQPAPAAPPPSPPPPTADTGYISYHALVQRRVWQALCSHRETAPGPYRAVMLLTVEAGGQLAAPRWLGNSGDPRRDRAIVTALQGLRLDAPPPAGLKQPLVLLIVPGSGDTGVRCPDGTGHE